MFNKAKAAKSKEQTQQKKARPNVVEMEDLLLDSARNREKTAPSEEHILVVRGPNFFYADDQVRKTFDTHEIEEMAASLRANGQIQPIVVYPADNDGRYKIDKGECRWRASQLIEGFELKAVIDPEAPNRAKKKRIVTQLVENDQRNDVPPLDMALALQELIDEGMTMEEVAIDIGWITRTSKKPNVNKVSRILSVLKLPEDGKKLIQDNVVTDLITLEFLRKIFEINKEKFSVLCDLAREEEGVSRKRAEQEYKQCKANAEADTKARSSSEAANPGAGEKAPSNIAEIAPQSVTEAETDGIVPADTPAANTSVSQPKIYVEWRGMQKGVLLFESAPEGKDYALLRLDSGDTISAELEDLKITRIVH